MSQQRERDASVERLLQRTRHASLDGSAGEACLDAETLAAWSEGSLRGEERAAAEAHAAGCARCQAMLAAMVRMEPANPDDAAWWQRRAALRWAVPLTAAAAVSIWVLTQPTGHFDPERSETEVPSAARTAESPARQTQKEGRLDVAQAPEAAQSPDRPVTPPAPSAPPTSEQDRKLEKGARAVIGARSREEAAGMAAGASLPQPTEPPLGAASAPAPPIGLAETVTTGDSMRKAAPAAIDVISPDAAIRWRVGARGLVQRSTDAGLTWQTQVSGVTTDLTAASAPGAFTCWAVGHAGTALLTTDGVAWKRLAFPEPADLVSIAATDAYRATVTTADGRVFQTTDGGLTWRRQRP